MFICFYWFLEVKIGAKNSHKKLQLGNCGFQLGKSSNGLVKWKLYV